MQQDRRYDWLLQNQHRRWQVSRKNKTASIAMHRSAILKISAEDCRCWSSWRQ